MYLENVKSLPCIILSSNSSYAYKVRLKLNNLGIKAEYKNRYFELLDFIIENDEGLIFIYTKSRTCQKYIEKYTLSKMGKNFTFVFLQDNIEMVINPDNKYLFVSTYENIQDIIPMILLQTNVRKCNLNKISSEKIEKYLSLILKSFNISSNYLGYHYIKDCVHLLNGDGKKDYPTIKEVYKIIGQKYNKLASNIEKSIRICIRKSQSKASDIYSCIFLNGKISNSLFINFLLDKIKMMNNEVIAE